MENLDDGSVEVGEDDLGMRVLAPEPVESRTEHCVVALGHAVDSTQAAEAIVVCRVRAHEEREDNWRAPPWRVSRHDHVNRALVDQPLQYPKLKQCKQEYK